MVTVRLFASLREWAGRSELFVALPRPVPLRAFWRKIEGELPFVMDWVRKKRVLVAVNEEMATDETLIRDGDEVGLMPPFSGGAVRGRSARPGARRPPTAGRSWTRLQAADFSIDDELRRIKAVSKRIGGIAVFLGTARDHSRGRVVSGLSYEHYEGLAERALAGVRERALKRFDVIEIGLIHRTGAVPIGGNIVLVLAAAPHREEAFRACRWCIDELKLVVPIWKKESTPEGEIWVEDRP